ncbi:hypothetical protein IMZ48_41715, partial [Candidatus Bathyarchaeota archaeon]|nr:hypothetical protein [Candidatus Bathyarchaeota archaeon]
MEKAHSTEIKAMMLADIAKTKAMIEEHRKDVSDFGKEIAALGAKLNEVLQLAYEHRDRGIALQQSLDRLEQERVADRRQLDEYRVFDYVQQLVGVQEDGPLLPGGAVDVGHLDDSSSDEDGFFSI